MNRFNDFVKTHDLAMPILPICHTCEAIEFREIINEGKLNLHKCDVFPGEELLYFFYGKPSYRPKSTEQSTNLSAFFPVCFILKHEALNQLARVAPFDTGAYKLYSKHLHPSMTLKDFLLDGTIDMPPRIVKCFYGNNMNYIKSEIQPISSPKLAHEVESYATLASDRTISTYDNRCSTIEIQAKAAVNLDENTLLAVALPLTFLDDPAIRDILVDKWKVKLLTYHTYKAQPSVFVAVINEKVIEHLESIKAI